MKLLVVANCWSSSGSGPRAFNRNNWNLPRIVKGQLIPSLAASVQVSAQEIRLQDRQSFHPEAPDASDQPIEQ